MTDREIHRDIESIKTSHPVAYTTASGLYATGLKSRGDKRAACMVLAEAAALQAKLESPEKKVSQRHDNKMRFNH